MKKYIIILTLSLLALASCEKQWDNVPEQKLTTEQDITAAGYTIISVNELKQNYFYDHTAVPGSLVKSYRIEDKVAIKTKVISSDELGNTYRSIYLQDARGVEFGGIEVKVGKGSLYTVYKPGQIVYVKCDELELGNYRWMLSLGGKSSDASYSNGYIDIQTIIDEKMLVGPIEGLTAADTLVVNSSNVASVLAKEQQYLGTLCRFEGIESIWGTVNHNSYSGSDRFPSFLENLNGVYTNYVYGDYKNNPDYPEGLPATWAYSYYDENGTSNSYYGSALFAFSDAYPFIIRTSGYSRFALNPVPADGEILDITAILTKYCASGGGWEKYQLLLNSDKDVVPAN